MLIKIYNQGGEVKVTKTMNHRELTMATGIKSGEVAEIEVGVSQYTVTRKHPSAISDDVTVKPNPEDKPTHHAAT